MSYRWALAAALACVLALCPPPAAAEPCPIDHTHAAWSALLARHVTGGVVDYGAWKGSDGPALDAYLAQLSSACAAGYATWSGPQQIAFWLNAYNAFTVRLVLDNYPLASIRSIGLLPMAAFRKRFIPMPGLKGGAVSLDDIENDTLRKDFREPRIHFALVCASKSCPPLRAEAYRGDDLDRQLDDQTRAFLRDPAKNRVDAVTRTVSLSSIFKWFEGDFTAAAGSAPAFVARYLDTREAAVANDPKASVVYLDYDWSLNGR